MVQVQVPEGAGPGMTVAYTMPSGTMVQIVVPGGAGPGTILEVADPGVQQQYHPVVAVEQSTIQAQPGTTYAQPMPQYAPPQPASNMAEVVGIEKMGSVSAINGMSVVGPQHVPAGFDMMGDKYGIVARMLAPGEVFYSEPGAMMFMSNSVILEAQFNQGGAMGTLSTVASGEALMKVAYRNNGAEPGYVALTANQPFSMVLPIHMGALPNQTINLKRGAYMAGTQDVTAKMKFLPAKNCVACCCGGMPPIIQEVTGAPWGTAFLSASGTIVTKNLAPGETILVDSNAIVGFENSVGFDVRQVGNFLTCCFGGEGCFNTELAGPGNVYLSSITIDGLMSQLVTVQQDGEGGDGGGAPVASDNIAC